MAILPSTLSIHTRIILRTDIVSRFLWELGLLVSVSVYVQLCHGVSEGSLHSNPDKASNWYASPHKPL